MLFLISCHSEGAAWRIPLKYLRRSFTFIQDDNINFLSFYKEIGDIMILRLVIVMSFINLNGYTMKYGLVKYDQYEIYITLDLLSQFILLLIKIIYIKY